MNASGGAAVAVKIACGCALGLVSLGALGPRLAPAARAAPQVHAVNMATRQAAGRVVFCVTKDTVIVAAADGGAADSRPPAVQPLGAGRIAVLLGAADWTRDNGKPTQLDEELPDIARRVFNASAKVDPLDQSASDIEAIGVTFLEFVRPLVTDIHYKLNLPANEPLIEVLLAGYTPGYGPEIWDLRYRVQQQDLGSDYWDTRPMRPAYYQLYPPEKGQPRTFIEARYPASLKPLDLARASQSDAQVQQIRRSSDDIDKAVTSVLNGDSVKANARPVEDFVRLAMPVAAGPQAKLAIAAIDEIGHFEWLLEPVDARPAPVENDTIKTNAPPGQQTQTDRPTLRRAGPPTAP